MKTSTIKLTAKERIIVKDEVRQSIQDNDIERSKELLEKYRLTSSSFLTDAVKNDRELLVNYLIDERHVKVNDSVLANAIKYRKKVITHKLLTGKILHPSDKQMIFYACSAGWFNMIPVLMNLGYRDGEGKALSTCTFLGKRNAIRYLLKHNKYRITDFDSAIINASAGGHLDIVRFFVEKHNGSVSACGNISLQMAAANGNLDVAKYLVEQGATIDACNSLALRFALDSKKYDMAQYLIDGSELSLDAKNLLCNAAVVNCDRAAVEFYIRNGSDIDLSDMLFNCITHGNYKVGKFLLIFGIKIEPEVYKQLLYRATKMTVRFLDRYNDQLVGVTEIEK